MNDSSTNSSLGDSNSSSNDSTKKQLQVHKELRHINDLTNAVMKENTQLRAQFEHATSITSEIENINRKNIVMSGQIRRLQNENADLNHRLQISLKAREEIESKIEDEKVKASQQIQTERENKNMEMINNDKNHKSQLDQLYGDLDKLQTFSNECELNKRILETQLEKIFDSASHHFSQNIKSVDALIAVLESINKSEAICQKQQQPQQQQNTYGVNSRSANAIISSTANNQNLDPNFQYSGKTNQINKKDRNTIKKLKEEIEQLKNDLSKVNHSSKQISLEFERKILSLNDDYEMKDLDHKRETDRLQNKVDLLEKDLKKRKKQLQKVAAELETYKINHLSTFTNMQNLQNPQNQKNLNSYTGKHHNSDELANVNSELLQHNEDLKKEIEKLNSKIDDLNRIVDNKEKEIAETKNDSQKNLNCAESLKLLQTETAKEVETLRKALLSKKDENILSKQKRHINKLKIEVTSLQKTIDALQEENEKLKVERERFCHANEELEMKGSETNEALISSNLENKELKEEIKELQIELQRRAKATAEDFISLESFILPQYPQDLKETLLKISENRFLSMNSKISGTLKEVVEYYSNSSNDIRKELKIQITEKQQIYHELQNTKVNLALALDIIPQNTKIEDYDAFAEKNNGNNLHNTNLRALNSVELVDEVRKIKQQLTDSLRSNKEKNDFINNLKTVINCENKYEDNVNAFSNIVNEVEEINKKLMLALQCIEKEKKRALKYKNILNKERQNNEQNSQIMKNEIISYKNKTESLEEEVKRAKKQIDSMKFNDQQMKTDVSRIKDENESRIKKLEEEIEENQNKFNLEKNSLEAQFRCQIESKNTQLESQTNNLKDTESLIASLNKTIATQKMIIDDKKGELQSKINESTKIISRLKESNQQEKEQLVVSYSNTLKELQNQCEKHRKDTISISSDLNKEKSKNETLRKKNKKLQMSLCEMKLDNEKLKETRDRENKLNDVTNKATFSAIENKFVNQVNEMKSRLEKEKRKIIGIAAEEFREYFNANEAIDENQFRRILHQASEEIKKLRANEETIKKMLFNSGCESACESVAQLLIKK